VCVCVYKDTDTFIAYLCCRSFLIHPSRITLSEPCARVTRPLAKRSTSTASNPKRNREIIARLSTQLLTSAAYPFLSARLSFPVCHGHACNRSSPLLTSVDCLHHNKTTKQRQFRLGINESRIAPYPTRNRVNPVHTAYLTTLEEGYTSDVVRISHI
jgi:hypothetical protein